MTGRAKTGGFSEDLAKTPGPGRYDTTDPSVTKTKRPAYTMGPRSFMPGGMYKNTLIVKCLLLLLSSCCCFLYSDLPQFFACDLYSSAVILEKIP